MVLTPVDNSNARLSIHETIENLFANRGHSGRAQRFIYDRRDDRHWLSAADQRVTKFIGVHFHKVGAIYNNCTCGSILNVQ
jgi:hypothetical protein